VIIEVVPGHCKRTTNERSEAKMKAYPGRLRIDLDLCVSDTFAFGLLFFLLRQCDFFLKERSEKKNISLPCLVF